MDTDVGTEDPYNFAENAKHLLEGAESPDLAAAWCEFPQITDDKQRDIVKLFLNECLILIEVSRYVTEQS